MGQRLNLNEASVEELAALPGVGTRTAQLIVDARESGGFFCNTSGMISIAGVTPEVCASLAKYTFASPVVISSLPAWMAAGDPLLQKFRALYEENSELAESVDTHFKQVAKAHNPGFDDTVDPIDADAAHALYVDAVQHAMRKLEEDPDIEPFDAWEIPAGSRREYGKPVLVCRRFTLGPSAEFVIGQNINPTITIIAEEIDMAPDAVWSWTPRHGILATPAGVNGGPGQPSFNPESYASGQPAHVNGLNGGAGGDGLDGACPDDLPGEGHTACEAPTVQIIALRVLSLSQFDLRGQDGARGGRGGNGGPGGHGSRGRDGEEGFGPGPFFIPIPYCKRSPGQGGLGGPGGDAGDGGRGGNGGDGGTFRLFTTPESLENLLRNQPDFFPELEGGDGGAGGEPGLPGEPGRQGLHGAVPRACRFESRIIDAMPGRPGERGMPGSDGSTGGLSFVLISDLDFDLILDLPILEGLRPTAAPPGAQVELIGRNLGTATGVIFSTHPHLLSIAHTSAGHFFTVPDVAGGWAEVSIENGGHVAPDWTLEAVEFDFMVTPRIDRIDGPAPGTRSVWLDSFTIQGVGFRPDSDRVRIDINGDFFTGIIDPQQSSQHQLVFRLPQVDALVDVPQGDWDTVVIGVYGYGSNTAPLELHACRSVPLRPMPLFADWNTSDYPYRPCGFYFHNFSQGLPDWDLFLDTYGTRNIGARVAIDILFNAVVMSGIGALSPVGGRLGPLLTLPGTVGYFYAVWYFFLNGTIGEGMCTGMSAQALLDHLDGVDCLGRPWDGTDTTARRLITLGASRLLSDEVLFGILYGQCTQEAASIPQAYRAIRGLMASEYNHDEAPILFFLPSGEISDEPEDFFELLRSTHAVVPYMIVENVPTTVDVAGVSVIRQADRIYIYDSNQPFAPYDAGISGLDNEAANALRPHPSAWDTLPICSTTAVTPCRQTPGGPDDALTYVAVWDETPGTGDWRFHYDAATNSDAGFTLGVSPLRPFNGESYLNLPVESWFGLLNQVVELLLSPAVLKDVYRWNPEAEDGLGDRWDTASSASPKGRPPSHTHEIHFVRREGPSVRKLRGTEDNGTYSYRSFDPRLDVSLVNMPTEDGELDFLYLDPEERIIELRTHRSSTKRVHLLVQRWTGEEAQYLSLRNLPLSAEQPLRLTVNRTWTDFRLESPAEGWKVAYTLIRLTADGAARQHKEELLLKDGGAGLTFESWAGVCDQFLDLAPADRHSWILRDRVELSGPGSEACMAQHNYRRRQRPPKGSKTSTGETAMAAEAITVDAASATAASASASPEAQAPLHLPADAMWVESFRVENLIPRKPLKIVRTMSNRGNFQQARVLVNGQGITRSDWIIEAPPQRKTPQDVAKPAGRDLPGSPLSHFKIPTMRSEFVVPASYVTAPDLELRIEVVDSDFSPNPLLYEVFQEPLFTLVAIYNEDVGRDAMVELDNGSLLPMGVLLDMVSHRRIAVKGLKVARLSDKLSVCWERPIPQGADLRVTDLKRNASGRPQRVYLSDGSSYSAEEFIALLEAGAFRVRNAYLAGEPDALRIELTDEAGPKPFEQSVKALFSRGGRKKPKAGYRDS
jgi:hypothetical protein